MSCPLTKSDIVAIAEQVDLRLFPLPDVTYGYICHLLLNNPHPQAFLEEIFTTFRKYLENMDWKYRHTVGEQFELYPWILDLLVQHGVIGEDWSRLPEYALLPPPDTNILPVKINIDGTDITYGMSEEYAAGVYQGGLTLGINLQMRMYGEVYARDYLNSYDFPSSFYACKINDVFTQFDGREFIEGFRFIMNRMGYDGDAYITDIVENS